MCFYLNILHQFHVVLTFYRTILHIIPTFYFLTTIHADAFHFNVTYICLHVFLFKNVNINFMLYLFYMRPTVHAFHFNIICNTKYNYKFYSFKNIVLLYLTNQLMSIL